MEKYVSTDNAYPRLVLNCLHDMQKADILCDMKLTVKNNSINVHKIILNAVSPYFKWLAETGTYKENSENEIVFQNLDFNILEIIINFIYTGVIELNESNVLEVMEAADMLGISVLKPAICKFLIQSINISNCLKILTYAKQFNYEELTEIILEIIWQRFCGTTETDMWKFSDIPTDIMSLVLCNTSLKISETCYVFELWATHNIPDACPISFKRKLKLDQYLAHLEYLANLDSRSSDDVAFIHKFKDYTIKRLLNNYETISGDEDPFNTEVDKTEIPIVLVFGGASLNNKILSYVECNVNQHWSPQIPIVFKPKDRNQQVGQAIPIMKTSRHSFAIASRRHEVFIIGGYDGSRALDSCEVYNVSWNEWTEFKSLPKPLQGCRAVMLENKLIVSGGMDDKGNSTSEVWKYNQRENEWKKFPNMLEPRAFHGMCSVRGVLYVIAGKGAKPGSMERYDESLGRWAYVTAMPVNKEFFGYVAFEEFIYVFGGMEIREDKDISNTVNRYNTLTDTWESFPDMLARKSGMACTVKDGKIYLIGGYGDNVESLGRTDIYNPKTGRCHVTSAEMNNERKFSGAVTVYIPSLHKQLYHTGL